MPRRRRGRPWQPGDGDLWKELWPTYAEEQRAAAEQRTRVEIAEQTELRAMSYGQSLAWAAGRDGRLDSERLRRVARVRGYDDRWVERCAGRDWKEVRDSARAWRKHWARED
jgi:hypothetical protein